MKRFALFIMVAMVAAVSFGLFIMIEQADAARRRARRPKAKLVIRLSNVSGASGKFGIRTTATTRRGKVVSKIRKRELLVNGETELFSLGFPRRIYGPTPSVTVEVVEKVGPRNWVTVVTTEFPAELKVRETLDLGTVEITPPEGGSGGGTTAPTSEQILQICNNSGRAIIGDTDGSLDADEVAVVLSHPDFGGITDPYWIPATITSPFFPGVILPQNCGEIVLPAGYPPLEELTVLIFFHGSSEFATYAAETTDVRDGERFIVIQPDDVEPIPDSDGGS